MINFKNDKRIMFIPGWLDLGEVHGHENSLDLWNKNIDTKKNLNVDLVIAHSIGSLVALDNWNIHKNFKIILINPTLLKKNIFKRYFQSMFREGTHYPFKRILIFVFIFSAFVKAMKLFKVPALDIVKNIPKDNLTIIYGENDKYLCDRKLVEIFRQDGFKVIEVKKVGHNYNIEIEKIISDLLEIK